MQEMDEIQIQSLGQEEPLEKEMAIRSSILACEIPWTEEPGGLQYMRSQRVKHDLETNYFAGHQKLIQHCTSSILKQQKSIV